MMYIHMEQRIFRRLLIGIFLMFSLFMHEYVRGQVDTSKISFLEMSLEELMELEVSICFKDPSEIFRRPRNHTCDY